MRRLLEIAGLALALLVTGLAPSAAVAQDETNIVIDQGTLRARPVSVPDFIGPDPASAERGAQIAAVIVNNLTNSGWFTVSDPASHIGSIPDINIQPRFSDWRTIGSEALVTGEAVLDGSGGLRVAFRLWNVQTQQQVAGLRFETNEDNWRRVAHQISDRIYERIIGDEGYFDTQIVFIHESGPKTNPVTRLAIMDQDGANSEFLTDGDYWVFLPTFSSRGRQIVYVSYRDGPPMTYLFDLDTGDELPLFTVNQEVESYAARFSPDDRQLVMTQSTRGNADIHLYDIQSGRMQRLTTEPSIDTEPSFSPDGRQIVFRSNRSGEGTGNLYVMNADGTGVRRITFGQGIYSTPVWSPRGDYIAFTNQSGGVFRLGVIRPDGSGERLLTQAFKIDRPTWSPNGRVIMFPVELPGTSLRKELRAIDITGRNERIVPTPGNASDPAWSPVLE